MVLNKRTDAFMSTHTYKDNIHHVTKKVSNQSDNISGKRLILTHSNPPRSTGTGLAVI